MRGAKPKPRSHYIVPCPVCGQEKWRYQGNDLDHEPPCADCQRADHSGRSGGSDDR